MPPSKIHPEDTYAAFDTREAFTAIAHRLGVVRLTLRRWWIAKFGEDAVRSRPSRIRQTLEEAQVRAKAYREANKEQVAARKKAWTEANKETVLARKRAWHEAHSQEHRAYCRAYYASKAEEFRVYARRYRAENAAEMRTKERAYYTQHPEAALLKGARQRARRFGVPCSITMEDIRAVLPADLCCPVRRTPFERGVGKVGPNSMTLDRVAPALGYVPGNIAVISHLANTMKQNCTDPGVLRRLADYVEGKPLMGSLLVRSI